MHVERNRDEIARHGFTDEVALVVGGILQQLLTEVVTKGICSKFRNVLSISLNVSYPSSSRRSG